MPNIVHKFTLYNTSVFVPIMQVNPTFSAKNELWTVWQQRFILFLEPIVSPTLSDVPTVFSGFDWCCLDSMRVCAGNEKLYMSLGISIVAVKFQWYYTFAKRFAKQLYYLFKAWTFFLFNFLVCSFFYFWTIVFCRVISHTLFSLNLAFKLCVDWVLCNWLNN